MSRHRRYFADARKRAADLACSAGSDLVSKLSKLLIAPLKPGRNNTKSGLPFDVDDQNPDEGGLSITAVDRDAATDLVKELRRAGLKAKRSSNTEILIEASHSDVACAEGPAFTLKKLRHTKSGYFDVVVADKSGSVETYVKSPTEVVRWVKLYTGRDVSGDVKSLSKPGQEKAYSASHGDVACSTATFRFQNAKQAKEFQDKVRTAERGNDEYLSATWDGNDAVKVKSANDAKMREAKALARKVWPEIKLSQGDVACSVDELQVVRAAVADINKHIDNIERTMQIGTWSDKAKRLLDEGHNNLMRAAVNLKNAMTKP